MIIDTFVMKYVADTKDATGSIDDLDKKSKDAANTLGTVVSDAAKAAGSSISESFSTASKSADEASKSSEVLAKSYEKSGDAAEKSGNRAKKAHKDAAESANNEASANNKLADSASKRQNAESLAEGIRMDKIGQKFKNLVKTMVLKKISPVETPPSSGNGGGKQPPGFLSKAADQGGELAGGVAKSLPGASGLVALGGAATAAAAAVMIFSKVIGVANEQADKAMHLKETAWKSGMNEYQYNSAVIRGKRMGATEEEVRASREGIADKVRTAKAQPYGAEAYWMKRAGIRVGGGRDIENITQQILNHARQMAKTKGEAEAIAWATQRMGMSFAEASRYVSMTDAELKQYNASTLRQQVEMEIAQAKLKNYAEAKRQLDNQFERSAVKIAGQVAPSLTKFSKALEESASKTDGVVGNIGMLTSALVDLAAGAMKAADAVTGWLNKIGREIGDSLSESKTVEAEAMATGKSVQQVKMERAAQGFSDSIFNSSDVNKKIRDQNVAGLKEKYPDSDVLKRIESGKNQMSSNAPSLIVKDTAKPKDPLFSQLLEEAKKQSESDSVLSNNMSGVEQHLAELVEQGRKDGLSDEEMIKMGRTTIAQNAKQGNIIEAQAKHLTPPIPVQPVDIGLEQALSLWASGVGKAAGFTGPEGQASGGSRAEYEKEAKRQMEAKRSIAFQGSALVGSDMTKAAITGAREATRDISSAKSGGTVSLNQTNNFNITATDQNAGQRVGAAIRQSNNAAARSLANSQSDLLSI